MQNWEEKTTLNEDAKDGVTRKETTNWTFITEKDILVIMSKTSGDDYDSITQNLKQMNKEEKAIAVHLSLFAALVRNSILRKGRIEDELSIPISWLTPKFFLKASRPLMLVVANNTAFCLLGHILIKLKFQEVASYAWNNRYGSTSIWDENIQGKKYDNDSILKRRITSTHSWDFIKAKDLYEAATDTVLPDNHGS